MRAVDLFQFHRPHNRNYRHHRIIPSRCAIALALSLQSPQIDYQLHSIRYYILSHFLTAPSISINSNLPNHHHIFFQHLSQTRLSFQPSPFTPSPQPSPSAPDIQLSYLRIATAVHISTSDIQICIFIPPPPTTSPQIAAAPIFTHRRAYRNIVRHYRSAIISIAHCFYFNQRTIPAAALSSYAFHILHSPTTLLSTLHQQPFFFFLSIRVSQFIRISYSSQPLFA